MGVLVKFFPGVIMISLILVTFQLGMVQNLFMGRSMMGDQSLFLQYPSIYLISSVRD